MALVNNTAWSWKQKDHTCAHIFRFCATLRIECSEKWLWIKYICWCRGKFKGHPGKCWKWRGTMGNVNEEPQEVRCWLKMWDAEQLGSGEGLCHFKGTESKRTLRLQPCPFVLYCPLWLAMEYNTRHFPCGSSSKQRYLLILDCGPLLRIWWEHFQFPFRKRMQYAKLQVEMLIARELGKAYYFERTL